MGWGGVGSSNQQRDQITPAIDLSRLGCQLRQNFRRRWGFIQLRDTMGLVRRSTFVRDEGAAWREGKEE